MLLKDNPLGGVIPASIGNLTKLKILNLINARLTGSIPAGFYSLSSITEVQINNNKLEGSLSENLGNLTTLQKLFVNQNENLSGTIPSSIGNLTKMTNLNISNTSISGAVPVEMANCSSLQNFMAFKTKLTDIGDNWDQYPAIKLIQCHSTPTLEGPLPASIGRSTTVTSIQMYGCNFTGNIPDSWANLSTACGFLQVYQNKLSGVLPVAFVQHTNYVNNKWIPAINILPQQEGFGLTEPVPNE